jgi:hypothetical protein
MSSLYLPGTQFNVGDQCLYAPPTHLYASFASLPDLSGSGSFTGASRSTEASPSRRSNLLGTHRPESGAHLYTIPAETRERIDHAYVDFASSPAPRSSVTSALTPPISAATVVDDDSYGDVGALLSPHPRSSSTSSALDASPAPALGGEIDGAYADDGIALPSSPSVCGRSSSGSGQAERRKAAASVSRSMPPLPTVLSRSYSAIFSESEEDAPLNDTIQRRASRSVFARGRGYGHAAHLLENAYTTPLTPPEKPDTVDSSTVVSPRKSADSVVAPKERTVKEALVLDESSYAGRSLR